MDLRNINIKHLVNNFIFPGHITKTHLMLIAKKCKDNETQKIFFFQRVINDGLTTEHLKQLLVNTLPINNDDNSVLLLDSFVLKEHYDLSGLNID